MANDSALRMGTISLGKDIGFSSKRDAVYVRGTL